MDAVLRSRCVHALHNTARSFCPYSDSPHCMSVCFACPLTRYALTAATRSARLNASVMSRFTNSSCKSLVGSATCFWAGSGVGL